MRSGYRVGVTVADLPRLAFASKRGRHAKLERGRLVPSAYSRVPPFDLENRREVQAHVLGNGLDARHLSVLDRVE